jgi:hypothetical protein
MSRGTFVQFNKALCCVIVSHLLYPYVEVTPGFLPLTRTGDGSFLQYFLDSILSISGEQKLGEGSKAGMGWRDLFLHLISVWLVANTAVIAYLTWIYFADGLSENLNTASHQDHNGRGEQRRARILMINDTPSPQSGRGF